MTKKLCCLVFSLALLAFSGCGKSDTSTGGSASTSAAATSGPRTIELTAGDNMHYNITAIEAKPGEPLTVSLTNIGTMPKEAMGHNWILLKQGSDPAAFSAAAATAKDTDYIPPALKDEMITHIDLLGPRKTGETTFNAPMQPGQYPFLCSFPAHYLTGMKGVLTVK